MVIKDENFKSFKEFYPFYLSEHQNPSCKLMHFIGTSLVLLLVIFALVLNDYKLMYYMPLIGYGFAWVGHFFVEGNRPATFGHPFYSLAADYRMVFLMLIGRMDAEVGQLVANASSEGS